MTHLKDAGPLRVSNLSVVAQKNLEKVACLWLREVPNDLCGEKVDLHLCMRQECELQHEHGCRGQHLEAHYVAARSPVLRGGENDMGLLLHLGDLHGAKISTSRCTSHQKQCSNKPTSHLDKEPQQSIEISLQRFHTFKPVHQHINLVNADDWR